MEVNIEQVAVNNAEATHDPESEEILSEHYLYELRYTDSDGEMSVGLMEKYPSKQTLERVIQTYLEEYPEITDAGECAFFIERKIMIDHRLGLKSYQELKNE